MVNIQDQYCLPVNFDAKKTTVPRLRSILLQYEVDHPSNAKKPALVKLVEEQVLPKQADLRDKMANVRRSSEGIEDVK